ncbi:glutathionylspermidine synthase family protein [Paracoccus litorisediminis]|uniref:glutathionylspermidine synthase family protein n=1 Tax=Paracoccus litorisediminis TaxID=2006130 RepID=UPI0037310521
MKLVTLAAREKYEELAETVGFDFHTMHGEKYWIDGEAYEFSLAQVEEDIEGPATELHEMAMEAVGEIVRDSALMDRMAIPAEHHDLIRKSWSEAEPHLYGRFDLSYDGKSPAKMLEYNADTPTSLFEAGVFQWGWLEDQIAAGQLAQGADQFNGIYEALSSRWPQIMKPGETLIHFAGDPDNKEDQATLRVLAETAEEAGFEAILTPLAEIGTDADGRFLDHEDRVIGTLFKLYPWEDLLLDDFASLIRGSRTRFVEPAWKAVLSNKGLMAVMWRMFEGHPNLLPCLFEDEIGKDTAFVRRTMLALRFSGMARKPVLSREGAGVTLTAPGGRIVEASGAEGYGHHPHILQALAPLPDFAGRRPVIGAWITGDRCTGLGIRDDRSAITGDLSRFVPHYLV